MKSKYNPTVRLVTDMRDLSRGAYIRAVTQVIGDNEAEKERAAPSLQNFLHHKATDLLCNQAGDSVGHANAEYNVEENELIVGLEPIDWAVQVAVPQSLRSHLLFNSRYPVMACHLGKRKMYDFMTKKVY